MPYGIEYVTVIGAGTMGAAIAGHLANAGIRCSLLDIVPAELTPEEQMLLDKSYDGFVRSGALLDEAGKDRDADRQMLMGPIEADHRVRAAPRSRRPCRSP